MHIELDSAGNYAGPVEIYQLTAPNGKQYIGQSQCHRRRSRRKEGWQAHGFEGRWKEHKQRAVAKDQESKCTALYASLRKYGPESFQKEILLRVSKAQANHYEAKFIALLDTLVPNGLNLTSGGDAVVFSDIARQRMSIASTGKLHSNKTKALVSSIGRIRSYARGMPALVTETKASRASATDAGYRTTVRLDGKAYTKSFVSKALSMSEKLRLAVEARDKFLRDLGLPAITDDPPT